jgi:hypothetical protein
MESREIWFNAWLGHIDKMHEARKAGLSTEGYSRAAMIAHMEYRLANAIEMQEAKKP